tara:strand:- start:740 stop:994 length:255 start_codon:yes stop_codon:yes gene_type:complete
MADEAKQKYYQDNKDTRLAYQRAYYKKNKALVRRRIELKKDKDPSWEEARKEYNRAYYQKNRAKIRKNRARLRENRAKSGSEKA